MKLKKDEGDPNFGPPSLLAIAKLI